MAHDRHDPPVQAGFSRSATALVTTLLVATIAGATLLGVRLSGEIEHVASDESVGDAPRMATDDAPVDGAHPLTTDVHSADPTLVVAASEVDRPVRSATNVLLDVPMNPDDDGIEHSNAPLDGGTFVALLPEGLIELARTTVWDERNSASLEQLMRLAFDADGDGVLDDLERIIAIRAMRGALWPTNGGDIVAAVRDGSTPVSGPASEAPLAPEDLRLHHDADELRRVDHGSHTDDSQSVDEPDPVVRATVIERFRLEDDGRLTAVEYGRFLRHYHARSERADLNGDGHVDEADLRLFLDVATPIVAE